MALIITRRTVSSRQAPWTGAAGLGEAWLGRVRSGGARLGEAGTEVGPGRVGRG